MTEIVRDVGDMWQFGNPSINPDGTNTATPFVDIDGDPADPTNVRIIIKLPNGTTEVYGWPSPQADGLATRESTGHFYVQRELTASGKWQSRLEGTGAVTAASEATVRVRRQRVLVPA